MRGKSIILALSPGKLRDDLLLCLGHRGAKAFVTLQERSIMKLLKTTIIDCILTQMMLKNEDAIELILRIRDINKDIPIILIDKTGEQNRNLAARLKVTAYFETPVASSEVCAVIEKALTQVAKSTRL